VRAAAKFSREIPTAGETSSAIWMHRSSVYSWAHTGSTAAHASENVTINDTTIKRPFMLHLPWRDTPEIE
jgi:hypothetical protein